MIDLDRETLVTLAEAPRLIPARENRMIESDRVPARRTLRRRQSRIDATRERLAKEHGV